MRYIIDSYAWVEYLEGSKLGEKVRDILTGKNEIYSLNLTIAEVISRVKRKKGSIEIAYNAINSNSKVAEITPEIAKKAGLFHMEIRSKIKNFGLVDALILILARELNAKILTGDKHFKGFKEAIFIS
ncbi:MAG TPA: PIN domain-containing protein [Candidatus Pacearchaeota archaeon]|nr:tRNA(fMet)-specific endonuclease VapC [archaeon BMS3Abin17]HDK41779.1 PIN domain-containing protein [Candidatus Pacearchaeota archaeon]